MQCTINCSGVAHTDSVPLCLCNSRLQRTRVGSRIWDRSTDIFSLRCRSEPRVRLSARYGERLDGKTDMRILMVGLDTAGKTTILYQLKRVRQSPLSAEYVLSSEGTSASPPELCVRVRLHPWRVPRKLFDVIVIYMATPHLAPCNLHVFVKHLILSPWKACDTITHVHHNHHVVQRVLQCLLWERNDLLHTSR